LGDVLHHIEQLKKVDVSNVEPAAHAFAVDNVWTDDTPQAGLAVERALKNAPAQRDHMIVVPKVVE
jgi:aspartyl-tRNA(Asn)/glutamyl-tRNA(Gln) amidotransferase subunit C